jgi:putative two-component system response regulator
MGLPSPAIEIPLHHHEHWDGTGYPGNLTGEHIPMPARIFAIADAWDALSNDRPYRKAWAHEQVIEHLLEQSGKQFDPTILDVFLKKVNKQ